MSVMLVLRDFMRGVCVADKNCGRQKLWQTGDLHARAFEQKQSVYETFRSPKEAP